MRPSLPVLAGLLALALLPLWSSPTGPVRPADGWVTASDRGSGSTSPGAVTESLRKGLDPDSQPPVSVFPGHPRLIVGGYRGPSVEALRLACQDPELEGVCDDLDTGTISDAMRYLLHGDEQAASRTRNWLVGGVRCDPSDSETSPAGGAALAYDWVADGTSPSHKERIERNLAACGLEIADVLRSNSPHLWHGYTPLAATLTMIALVLDDAPERDQLLADAHELFRQRSTEAFATVGGAWPEGYNYERTHFFGGSGMDQYVIAALQAWHTAVEQDTPDHGSIFETIAEDEGDWLRGVGYHVVYGTLPGYGDQEKRTLLRAGDMPTGQAYPNKQVRPWVDAIARAYDDGHLKTWGEALEADWSFSGGTGTYHTTWRYLIPYTLPLDVESQPLDGLPAFRVWGRDTIGHILGRTGWSDGDTVFAYRAGDWFTGHQHMDQGHFELWRRGPLAMDAGVYANWGSEHREGYYIRSVAHNTLLIPKAGETFHEHPSTDLGVNDGGQRIHTYRGCAQCMQSVAEWRSQRDEGLHFESGDLISVSVSDVGLLAASDLTAAYNSTRFTTPDNSPKVSSVERDVAFLLPSTLILIDRVVPVGEPPPSPPRFVVHLPAKPELEPMSVIDGGPDDGRLTSPDRHWTMDNGTGGRLVGRTLVPDATETTLIGGPSHRYWVDGANRLGGAELLAEPPAEPGLWRIETAPAESAPEYLTVNVLHPIDDTAEAPEVTRLDPGSDSAAASALALRVADPASEPAILLASAAVPRQPVNFVQLNITETTRVTVFNAEPSGDYRADTGSGQPLRVPADPDGVAHLMADPGPLTLALCPPPEDAGDAWKAACREPPTPTPPPTHTPDPADRARIYLPTAFMEATLPRR